MGQVGADDRQQVAADGQRVQDVGDLLRRGLADHERHAGPPAGEYPLQERELHLDRVLGLVGIVVDGDALMTLGQGCAGVDLHRNLADRGRERRGGRHGNTGQGDVVCRAQHGHATNRPVAKAGVGRGGHRT